MCSTATLQPILGSYFCADPKAVLIETIVDELLRKRSKRDKVADQAKKVLRRVDWMKVARKASSYGISLATGSLSSAGAGQEGRQGKVAVGRRKSGSDRSTCGTVGARWVEGCGG